ncbi:MAG: PucR family transcriptional regulator [Solirubrobacteraceae bacterium]
MPGRGADSSAPRSTPLTLVAGAVAGDDLASVAASVAQALGCPVAIAIPAHGAPVVSPPGSLTEEAAAAIAAYAQAAGSGDTAVPAPIAEAVPVRIGDQVVGIVAATAGGSSGEQRAWLEAAAAAASVTALIRESPGSDSGDALVAELAAGAPDDVSALLTRARRLGVDLSMGAVALSGRSPAEPGTTAAAAASEMTVVSPADGISAPNGREVLVAELRPGRVVAVAAASAADGAGPITALAATLRAHGMAVAVSAPRRDPALLHDAIREAELLAELAAAQGSLPSGHDETYRLLIGVLLRDRGELEQLRDSTVTTLAEYDGRHDTDLLPTLCAFLAHDGSTTETAEAMQLHRHTVGYRLSRVQEVSGLSPYESDGRERLGLGIKAQQILDADRRLDPGQPSR